MGDLTGFDAMLEQIRAKIEKVLDVTPDALDEAIRLVEAATKIMLTTTSHAPGTPTPSNPGDPPSLITGKLRGSVVTTPPAQVGEGRWEAKTGPTAVYGRIQELGGICGAGHRTRLPARPYLAPSLEASKQRLGQILGDAWESAVGN